LDEMTTFDKYAGRGVQMLQENVTAKCHSTARTHTDAA
jgi:hypothetical protein